jgi:hypothetical protein
VSAALHHSEVEARFAHRYFVSCEAASGSADVVLALAAQLGVSAQSGQALKEVLQRLSSTVEPTLLVLDNLESAWEAPEGRTEVEGVLGHLADLADLVLIVCCPVLQVFILLNETSWY